MKVCSKCKTERNRTDFRKCTANSDGLNSWCKYCYREDMRLRRLTKSGQDYANIQNWKRHSVPCTVELYDEMVEFQLGHCNICGEDREKLRPDHDHKTGKLRALLCNKCNLLLGLVGDSYLLLSDAANYLKEHNGNN